jgi:phage/plasmid-like protein (TIGR03299 family)
MAHNIDMSNGRANMAFLGSRNDIWHSLGTQMVEGMSIADWQKAGGLDWTALKVDALASMEDGPLAADGWKFLVRSDTKHVLGCVSDRYQPVQPADIFKWFEQYISVDPRFQLDVCGSLKNGEIIWATAKFNSDITVAGDKHVARLLMTTTFDGSGSTINRATMTRVVCNNTLDCALADKAKSVVRTRHNTKFDAEAVGAELARIAQGFEAYKEMGEAMAKRHLKPAQLSAFFKTMLGIDEESEKTEDVSKSKLNKLEELGNAYNMTVAEGTEPGTAWTALNAVTRWVDHDRAVRNGNGAPEGERRLLSAQFGSGYDLKAKAVAYLTDEDLLAAVSAKTAAEMDDNALLKAIAAASNSVNRLQ